MSFVKTNWFKYLKNLIIGVGASIVLLGSTYLSWKAGIMLVKC